MSIAIDKRIIPLTSLPRSGSTILMSILNQNKSFTVAPDSDLSKLLGNIRSWAAEEILVTQLSPKLFEESIFSFCREGATAWVNKNCKADFLIDKNRFWIHQHQFMFLIFPKIKFILNIRDLRFIVNSFLKIQSKTFSIDFQEYYFNVNEDFMFKKIKDILEFWFLKRGLISLKELIDINPSYRNQILIFRHEELILDPQNNMNRIYDFFELPRYDHNFDEIESICNHYDNHYVPYGDHQIKTKLETKLPETLSHLPQKYADWIVNEYRWYYEQFYPEVLR